MGGVTILFSLPSFVAGPGESRWIWSFPLAAGLAMVWVGLRLGRAIVVGDELRVRTVWTWQRFPVSDLEEVTVAKHRIGLGRVQRDVLVIVCAGRVHLLSDINATADGGKLEPICQAIRTLTHQRPPGT
jgi:hypothetical protein